MAVAHLAGALTSVRAVMEVRTAQGAIAWAISLNTFPYLAVPAYWVFGRSRFEGYQVARRLADQPARKLARETVDDLRQRGLLVPREEKEALWVERLAKLPATVGNDAELLIDGEATFRSILDGIGRAQKYVLVEFYILRDDGVGRGLKSALIARARDGLRVYVLYDEVGSGGLPRRYLEELRAAGVRILPFNTTQGPANRLQLNFRNHRKIVIVDGREAWVGGLNVGDEYQSLDPKVGYWRDTHARFAGPVVQCVQVAFYEDWNWAARESLTDLEWTPQPAPGGASRSVLCLPTGPADTLESCTLFFIRAIHLAKKRLWIASPYFVPDEQFITALQLAALRGVDVRILIPEQADNPLVQYSGWSYLEELEKTGVRTFRYTKGFMHQKVVVIDDDYSTIGTANFDNRSFRLNFEITMAVADREFTGRVIRMLEDDFAQARAVDAHELQSRGFWFRFAVRAARLTAPIQ
ncbi:MAG: cardiolipin synthase [Verrucomicrobiales bacterium]|nr:cardiolipin synthase [Verrucomicrobiales bacterium]